MKTESKYIHVPLTNNCLYKYMCINKDVNIYNCVEEGKLINIFYIILIKYYNLDIFELIYYTYL